MPDLRRLGERLTESLGDGAPVTDPSSNTGSSSIGREEAFLRYPDGAQRSDVNLRRDPERPYDRQLLPDVEGHPEDFDLEKEPSVLTVMEELPSPRLTSSGPQPKWNSVALFFNLPPSDRPGSYSTTSSSDVKEFLDEGKNPVEPGISEFLRNYWHTLSYGNLAFGLDAPRDASGKPIVPEIQAPGGKSEDWSGLIFKCIDANPEAIWQAAGGLTKDGKRLIPSVVLVQNYRVSASAHFGPVEHSVGGHTYLIGDRTHIGFSLDRTETLHPKYADRVGGRVWWGTLCHEYAHNFLEFGDLYGPQGATGYWDLLGDHSPPGVMSEVSSVIKERAGWLSFNEVIEGPRVSSRDFSLDPYTTSGDAIKVVPDPKHTPHEFFLLEYRTSTGNELWRPDGGLPEEGLLITHINDRLGIADNWLLREAPFFDPEFADTSKRNQVNWTGFKNLKGKLFPHDGKDSFGPWTTPSSRLYGGRDSGLQITNIRTEQGECRFTLEMQGNPSVGWNVSAEDRAVAGRFTSDSATEGEEIFLRDDNSAALLVHKQAQWMVEKRHQGGLVGQRPFSNLSLQSWDLHSEDRELVGDFDGDSRDEIYIRRPQRAGVLEWGSGRFRVVATHDDRVDEWNLGPDNWERVADIDGDGQAEVYIRSPQWAGVMKLVHDRLHLLRMHHDEIDDWNLGEGDNELVGRFSQPDHDEIAIRSPEWLGLLRWDSPTNRLRLTRLQHDRIDGWNLGPDNFHAVADLDGDGRDEIFIRSPDWAGVLKWDGGRFRVRWMKSGHIDHADGVHNHRVNLLDSDQIYSGRFRSDREAILHRHDTDGGLAVFALDPDSGEVKVVRRLPEPFSNRWSLDSKDRFVLGDFHRSGRDTAAPKLDYVIDGLTDIFIHNDQGTGMVGVNHGQWHPSRPNGILNQMGLTWMQKGVLMDSE